MSAPDFYFAVNAMARHIHDLYGMEALTDYWRSLGREYYSQRIEQWRAGGPAAVAADWHDYFALEPRGDVEVRADERSAELMVKVCPAITHLRAHGREIVPYFCEHCDQICGAMAEAAGFTFDRKGGMGACEQRFLRKTTDDQKNIIKGG